MAVHPATQLAMNDLGVLLTKMRGLYPPPYLDQSNVGITLRILMQAAENLADLADAQLTA